MEEEDRRDSIRLESVLKTALQRAYDITDDQFEEELALRCDTSLYYNVNVNINYNHHFTKSQKHLMIRRESPNAIYIDIYYKNGTVFQKVLSHEQWKMTYVNDTIRDINGDGLKDFVVDWYGSSGCCLKGFSNVYLMRADKRSFSNNFEFINPSFSPKEKVIRGICYGHPEETEMYKYKWNGEGVDTIEYIYYETNDKGIKTGKIISSKHEPIGNDSQPLKRLNSIPNEYTKIEGFSWFTGDLE